MYEILQKKKQRELDNLKAKQEEEDNYLKTEPADINKKHNDETDDAGVGKVDAEYGQGQNPAADGENETFLWGHQQNPRPAVAALQAVGSGKEAQRGCHENARSGRRAAQECGKNGKQAELQRIPR